MTNVLLEKKGPYAVATIHRPEALNALNSQVLADLAELLDTVEADKEIRVLVITGAGEKAFVAGADIGEMSTLTKAEGEAFGKKGNDVFRRLETLPIPTIAAVNGFALGGGCELSMSCDIRICADTAVFGQPEAGLGITPGFGGTQRLARLVGPGMAKQLIYTAKNIKADRCPRPCRIVWRPAPIICRVSPGCWRDCGSSADGRQRPSPAGSGSWRRRRCAA